MSLEYEQIIESVQNADFDNVMKLYNSGMNSIPFLFSCRHGHLNLAKWLWQQSNDHLCIATDGADGFRVACMHGHQEIAEWLWEMSDHSFLLRDEDRMDRDYIFSVACNHRKIYIAKWLWEIYEGNIEVFIEDNPYRIPPGHLCDMPLWLKMLNIADDLGDNYHYVNDEHPIQGFTGRQDLADAKWIWEICGDSISDDVFNEFFYHACSQGNLETVKWAFEVNGKNISMLEKHALWIPTKYKEIRQFLISNKIS